MLLNVNFVNIFKEIWQFFFSNKPERKKFFETLFSNSPKKLLNLPTSSCQQKIDLNQFLVLQNHFSSPKSTL
jgi:hypothetical protein